MSIASLVSVGSRALTANYAALQVTGNNIANANTAGYSRQNADFQSGGAQFGRSGFFGRGVDISTVTRAHSEFLTREAALTQAVASAEATRSTQLKQLESVFQTGEAGLGYAAALVFGAFTDVASRPQDSAARQVALARVGDLAQRFRSANDYLDTLQGGVALEMRASVATVNGLTQKIASLNQQIANVKVTGHAPNDLLDQRDLAISELSQLVQVTTIAADDGSTSVFMGGGQRLVLGSSATALATVADPYNPTKVQLGITEGGATRAFPPDFLAGGSIAGLLKFQNTDLAEARNLLGQMAVAVAGALNGQQALGLDLRQPPGAGVPLLSVGAAVSTPASSNAQSGGVPVASSVNGSGVRVSSVSIAVVDTTAVQASDYELFADPALAAGSYQLTRLSDGMTRTVVSGDIVDGMRIAIAAPAPAARDRFLLQPVAPALGGMFRMLDDPNGIAAASPVTALATPANTGTAAVASLRAVSTSLNANLTATLTFTDNLGNYSYSLVDSTGALATTNGTGSWTAGQPIELNGWRMELTGVPRSGDVFTVGKTAFPAGDNGNANAFVALRDVGLVGRQILSGGAIAPGQTATDAYATALARIGVRVQSVSAAASHSASMAADAKEAEAARSGVNLDEEAARLIQFQQSYQAAARMLQVAQSVFDSLLRAAAG